MARLLLLLLLLARRTTCDLRRRAGADLAGDYPFERLIPDSIAYCKSRLIQDANCCLDVRKPSGLIHRHLRREGTTWTDTAGMVRGADTLTMPEDADCSTPRMLWVHGGSWMYGSPTTTGYDVLTHKLAKAANIVVMALDYPLIPAGNFSSIQDATLAALRWLAVNGPKDCGTKYQPPLFIGGDSSGGGTALSLVLRLKQGPGPKLAGAVFFSPWTNLESNSPEYYTNAFAEVVYRGGFAGHWLGAWKTTAYVGDIMFRGNPSEMSWSFRKNALDYVGGSHHMLHDPMMSPYYADKEQLQGPGLPPMYFVVAGSESILGDSVVFAQKAALYGAEVKLDIMTNMWHDFPMYSEGCGGGKELWQGVRAWNNTAAFLKTVASDGRLKEADDLKNLRSPLTRFEHDMSLNLSAAWFMTTGRWNYALDVAQLLGAIGLNHSEEASASSPVVTADRPSDEAPSPARQVELAATDYPYARLIPDSIAFCHSKLIADPLCCYDEEKVPDITTMRMRRPGTEWICDFDICWSGILGRRGEDTLTSPKGATCSSPRILWVHGGSWLYGSPDSIGYDGLTNKLAHVAQAVVMALDYPLLPVGNFSTIQDATLEALRWLATHGPEGIECGSQHRPPVFIGGDSSGGGTALSLVLTLKKKPSLLPVKLAGAIFFSPWTNLECNTPEYYTNAFAEIVYRGGFDTRKNMTTYVGDIMFRDNPSKKSWYSVLNALDYVGKQAKLLRHPIMSPFYADRAELEGPGLPPMYFVVAGSESILGDSVIFAQKAAFYGAEVKLDIMTGMWHNFPMYSEGCGGGKELMQAVRAWNNTASFVTDIGNTGHLSGGEALTQTRSPLTSIVYDETLDASKTWFGSNGPWGSEPSWPGTTSSADLEEVTWPQGRHFALPSSTVLVGLIGMVVGAAMALIAVEWRDTMRSRRREELVLPLLA